jgi:membrane-associated protease RseP (regulator of RpoE activity)
MGQPPSDSPEIFVSTSALKPHVAVPVVLTSRAPEPVARYILLFLLTLLTTTVMGQGHYASFLVGFTDRPLDLSRWSLFAHGFLYSLSALTILGCHEFGHYYACRLYRVDASAPYFLPAPFIFGTLGAFIRIRQPLPSKRALFDIGIAGPIAGFVVAVPILLTGMYLSDVVQIPTNFDGVVYEMGEPLLFKMATWLTFGTVPEGYTVNMHPMAFAAWFGMLATALNLLPIGQLDGGHISYAVLGRRSTHVTIAGIACLVGLSFFSTSWIVWAVLMIAMLVMIGPHHPPVWDEHVPLDRTRLWLAVFAVLMFVLCFTPAPIQLVELLRGT